MKASGSQPTNCVVESGCKKPEDQLMLALIGRVVDHLFHLVRVAIRNRRQNLKISLHINVRHQQNLIVFPMPLNNSVI